MPTILQLYNEALAHCKHERLTSVSEDVPGRHYCDLHYESVLKYMIEQGYWNFALRSVHITYDPDVAPAFGFTHAFDKPTDFVKTYQISTSETFDPPCADWIDENNAFFADLDEIYLRYVSNSDDGYGYDLDRWTAKFQLAFTSELAYRILPNLAGSRTDMEDVFKAKEAYRNEALSYEAQREPSRRPPLGRWATNRFRGRASRREDRA